jgi:hypothetical protein
MEYTVTVDSDSVSELVRQSLADSLCVVASTHEVDYEGKALINSLLIVHEYYSTAAQHAELLDELQDDLQEFDVGLDFDTTDGDDFEIIEDEDSVTITLDGDSKTLEHLASKGMEYLILRQMFNNPSTDDLFRWIESGKALDQKE